ncbi:MAG: AMP-binding protein [Hyphomicrobiales bacterium]|nr:AMP-binding protein [Hyphomicrobiales bacterium]
MVIDNVETDTFSKFLIHHSKTRGEHPAIREKSRGIWRTTTWRGLADEAGSLACALHAKGLQRGGHVAFVGDNRPRLYVAMCATHWLGAVTVPLYRDATAKEMLSPIQSAEVTHIFAEDQEQVDKLLEILPQCPSIRFIVYDKDRGMRHYKQPQVISYEELLRQGREAEPLKRDFLQAEINRGAGQDVASVFFTADETGLAKGVVLTHSALISRARAAASVDDLNDADVALAYLPPAWIGQNLFSYVQPMIVGYCVCCPESAETMLADLREIGPTYFLAPPRVLESIVTQASIRMEGASGWRRGLYKSSMAMARWLGPRILSGEGVFIGFRPFYALGNLLVYAPLRGVLGMSRVRVAYTFGENVSPKVFMFFRSIGINLKQLYGSAESGFFVAMQRNGEVKPDTVGKPVEGVEVKFTPECEILVRSPGLFREYHNDTQATALAIRDGWLHTGDAGYLDDDGHLRVVDRLQNVGALHDGTLFTPKPLENRIKASPYIAEAVVFGDGRDTVCALIDIDAAAIGNWADKKNISYTGHADLASRDEVYALVADEIAKMSAQLASDPVLANAQVRRFVILHKELDPEDGMLTHMGAVRRDVVSKRYKALVEAMYEGHSSVNIDAETSDFIIRDVPTLTPMQSKRAA